MNCIKLQSGDVYRGSMSISKFFMFKLEFRFQDFHCVHANIKI